MILALACALTFLFHLFQARTVERLFAQLFVVLLIPIPLAAIGIALLVGEKSGAGQADPAQGQALEPRR